jgi:energy-converting hydrogenase Eha subunit B
LGKDLAWSKWGPTGAAARGVFTWNVCKPDCAASRTWDKSTANYALGDVVHTTKYGGLFEALTVHITGKKTGGFPRTMVYPQKPVG